MTAFGGYAEYIYWDSRRLIPVPDSLDPAKAIPLILNYIVAYQIMHHSANVKYGDKVLIIGASGGIGTALLQLGNLAGLKMYGIASKSKHCILTEYGATPIDYRTQDFVEVIRQEEPQRLDAVFDGMAGDYFGRSYSRLRRGGKLVGYGNPLSTAGMLKFLGQIIVFSLLPDGKSAQPYSTGLSRWDWRPFLEDWAALFKLLEEGKIDPVIAARFPILEASKANALLQSGQVIMRYLCHPNNLTNHHTASFCCSCRLLYRFARLLQLIHRDVFPNKSMIEQEEKGYIGQRWMRKSE